MKAGFSQRFSRPERQKRQRPHVPPEPGDAYAITDLDPFNRRADRGDGSDDLVSGNDVRLGVGEIAVDHVQVGTADAARGDAYEDVSAFRRLDPALDGQ